jgi:hypothetical protein
LVDIIKGDVLVGEAQRIQLLASRLKIVSLIARRKARRIRLATNFLVGGFLTLVVAACVFATTS